MKYTRVKYPVTLIWSSGLHEIYKCKIFCHSHLVLWSPWNIQEQNILSLLFGPLVSMKYTRAKYPVTQIWSSGPHEIYKSKISYHSDLVLWSPWNIQEQNILSLSFGPLVPMKYTRAKYPVTLIWSSGPHEINKSKISSHSDLVLWSPWNIHKQNILGLSFGPLVPMKYTRAKYTVTQIWSSCPHEIYKSKIYCHSDLVLWSPWNIREQNILSLSFGPLVSIK
jgi:hypothetical protein